MYSKLKCFIAIFISMTFIAFHAVEILTAANSNNQGHQNDIGYVGGSGNPTTLTLRRVDENNNVIENLVFTLTNNETNQSATLFTDYNGEVRFTLGNGYFALVEESFDGLIPIAPIVFRVSGLGHPVNISQYFDGAVFENGVNIIKNYFEAERYTDLSIIKLWDDDDNSHNTRPDEITVALLRDESIFETVLLSTENEWQYTWFGLSYNYDWQIEEIDIPQRYYAVYEQLDDTTIITNILTTNFDFPIDTIDIEVIKYWNDDESPHRPTEIDVALLENGEITNSVLDAIVTLSDENNWQYTWTRLDSNSTWKIDEIEVPVGYEKSFDITIEGNFHTVTLTNTLVEDPINYISLTVEKNWQDNDNPNRPLEVTIVLLQDNEITEYTVILNSYNDWSYTWDYLDTSYAWSIEEVDIPPGYYPIYELVQDSNRYYINVTNRMGDRTDNQNRPPIIHVPPFREGEDNDNQNWVPNNTNSIQNNVDTPSRDIPQIKSQKIIINPPISTENYTIQTPSNENNNIAYDDIEFLEPPATTNSQQARINPQTSDHSNYRMLLISTLAMLTSLWLFLKSET